MLSAIMVNMGTATELLPAVMSAGRKTRIPPSRLAMPLLGIGTIVGGMLTLIGATPTIILNEFLTASSLPPFHLLGQTPLVLPLTVLSIVLMVLLRRVILPRGEAEYTDLQGRSSKLIQAYALDHVLHEVVVRQDAPLAGKTLGECNLRARFAVYVLGVKRQGKILPLPCPCGVASG